MRRVGAVLRARSVVSLTALVLLLSGSPRPAAAAAEEPATPAVQELAARQWEELDTDEVLRFVRRLQQGEGEGLPPLGAGTVRRLLRGEGLPFGATDVLAAVLHGLFGAVVDNAALLGRLVLLAVVLAVLHLLHTAFEREAVASAAYAVIYLAMLAVALVAFHDSLEVARDLIRSLVDFMLATLPLLVTLLAGVGAFTSAALLSPAAVVLVNGVGIVTANWVLPLIFVGTVLDVANYLPGGVNLQRLAALIRRAGLLLLSLALLVFLGVMAVQGAAAGVADGVLLRTAKFGAGTFVPVLGGMFADAAELVIGSSLLLKNAVGVFGLVMVLLLAVFPLLKVLALILTFRLAAALVQPVAGGPFVQALGAMGDGLTLIGLAAAAVTVMFFLALTVILGTGNLTVMLR